MGPLLICFGALSTTQHSFQWGFHGEKVRQCKIWSFFNGECNQEKILRSYFYVNFRISEDCIHWMAFSQHLVWRKSQFLQKHVTYWFVMAGDGTNRPETVKTGDSGVRKSCHFFIRHSYFNPPPICREIPIFEWLTQWTTDQTESEYKWRKHNA